MEKYATIGLFFSILLYYKRNVSFLIKKVLKIRVNKKIKLIDCFPCFTWWLTLIISTIIAKLTNGSYEQAVIDSMLAFIIAFVIDNDK